MPNYKLIFQHTRETETVIHEHDVLEHMQELRLSIMDKFTDFYIEPEIIYTGPDGYYVDSNGVFHYLEVK